MLNRAENKTNLIEREKKAIIRNAEDVKKQNG
jgi:hypothetical protein